MNGEYRERKEEDEGEKKNHNTIEGEGEGAQKWSVMKLTPTGTTNPTESYGHTITSIGEKGEFILIGGSQEAGFSDRIFTYSFNTNEWNLIKPNSKADLVMPSRNFHTSILYKGHIYVFGGKSNGYWSDLWKYNISTNIWSRVPYSQPLAQIPSRRYGHSAVLYKNDIYIFGGYNSEGWHCSDLWKYSITNQLWTSVTCDTCPSARIHHTAVLDVSTSQKQMLVFGGIGPTPEGKAHLGDLWSFNFKTQKWRVIDDGKDSSVCRPSGRSGHSAVITTPGFMHVFGGFNNQSADTREDFYVYDIKQDAWKELDLVKSNLLCPSLKGTICNGVIGSKDLIVLFGGRDRFWNPHNDLYILKPVSKRWNNNHHNNHNANKTVILSQGTLDQEGVDVAALLDLLPDELYIRVFRYLSVYDVIQTARVCKRWREISEDAELWKFLAFGYFPAEVNQWSRHAEDINNHNSNFWRRLFITEALKKRCITTQEQNRIEEATSYPPWKQITFTKSSVLTFLDSTNRTLSSPLSIRIFVVGDPNVGKTSALLSISNNHSFTPRSLPSTLPATRIEYSVLQWRLILELSDTDSSRSLETQNCDSANVFYVCFSFVDRRSFLHVQQWVEECRRVNKDVPIVLVGTKLDLLRGGLYESGVTVEEGVEMAKEVGAQSFVPISSKEGENLSLSFDEAACAGVANKGGLGFDSGGLAPQRCCVQ